ncbi:MAG: methionyl-tRNA formyltransferase [Peptoniphilus sp.]|nr:methionyl-tRNA formyltransferase [Peptoniphilus sp.]
MKIVYMSSSKFGIRPLEKLSEKHDVLSVVTGKDKARGRGKKLKPTVIKKRAEELGLEIFQPDNINSESSVEYLKSLEADLFVVVSFGALLKKEVLEIPKYYCLNIHPSLLPKLRGAAPINRAIFNGDDRTALCIMKMDEGMDTGDVAAVQEVDIEGRNADELADHLSEIGADLILKVIEDLEKGEIEFTKQKDGYTYAEKIDKSEGYIDFNTWSSGDILRVLRAMPSRYAISTTYRGERFKITEIELLDEKTEGRPGEVIDNDKKLKIATIDGSFLIKRLQFPGKREMDVKSFLAGNKLELGEILGG